MCVEIYFRAIVYFTSDDAVNEFSHVSSAHSSFRSLNETPPFIITDASSPRLLEKLPLHGNLRYTKIDAVFANRSATKIE